MIGYVTRRVKRIWDRITPKKPPVVGRIRCREIGADDLNNVIDLLTKGFWRQPRAYWVGVMDVLTAHDTPDGYPKYGYMLENDGVAVGALLMIFTARVENGVAFVQCNESSYYVEAPFRFYASLLVSRGHRFKEVRYLDLTPAPHRLATLAAQKYKQFTKAVYIGFPVFFPPLPGATVRKVTTGFRDDRLDAADNMLLSKHAGYKKCIAVVCEVDGVLLPFVFVVLRKRGMPFAFLVYGKSQADFVRLAGNLGRFLAWRGIPMVMLDVDGPIHGLPGKLVAKYPKFWKGGTPPRLADLAFTEIAMFGVI